MRVISAPHEFNTDELYVDLRLDVLFVGPGTTGTRMGCARYFREHDPSVRIVAVDSVGSVTFGGSTGTAEHGANPRAHVSDRPTPWRWSR